MASSQGLVSASVQLPAASEVAVHSPLAAGLWSRPASVVLNSGEALLLGRKMIPNRAHPLPPFAVIATRGGANVTISSEGPVRAAGGEGIGSSRDSDAVIVSAVVPRDASLVALHTLLRGARASFRSAAVAYASAARGAARDEAGPLPEPPCVLVVGAEGAGRSTLVRQLGNLFFEDMMEGHNEGGSTTSPTSATDADVLAVVDADVTGGGGSGTSLPGAISCDFVTAAGAVQPLTYFCGATSVADAAAGDRYLDVATHMAQGLEVMRREALGALGGPSPAAPEAAERAAAPLVPMPFAGLLVDTVGLAPESLEAGAATTANGSAAASRAFGLVRDVSDIFKATHVVAVGRSKEEAALLAARLKTSVAALRRVEVVPYVPLRSASSVPVSPSVLATQRRIGRVDRPIAEYFNGGHHRPLAAHLQTFAASDLMLLDAVTFAVVTPSAALQGTLAAVPFRTPMDVIDAASICGFVVIKEVGQEYVSLLCPSRGPLPSSVLFVTTIAAPATMMASVTL